MRRLMVLLVVVLGCPTSATALGWHSFHADYAARIKVAKAADEMGLDVMLGHCTVGHRRGVTCTAYLFNAFDGYVRARLDHKAAKITSFAFIAPDP